MRVWRITYEERWDRGSYEEFGTVSVAAPTAESAIEKVRKRRLKRQYKTDEGVLCKVTGWRLTRLERGDELDY